MNQTDEFNEISPLDDDLLNVIGYYLIACFCLCVLSNSVLLIIFIRYKELRVALNLFTITISICNLLSSIQFPFIIDSTFNHRYKDLFRHYKLLKVTLKNIFYSFTFLNKMDQFIFWLCDECICDVFHGMCQHLFDDVHFVWTFLYSKISNVNKTIRWTLIFASSCVSGNESGFFSSLYYFIIFSLTFILSWCLRIAFSPQYAINP
jgi:hypothetical protein